MKIRIENFRLEPLEAGRYIHPCLARFRMDGEQKSWEVLRSRDSVAILLWHRERERFILVRQFRPPVYLSNGEGMTVELCAGLLDKPELSPEEVAREEIEEECGYRVASEDLQRITSFYTSVGHSGSRQILYYAEVTEAMRTGPGGGVPGEEKIEVVEYTLQEARSLAEDETIARTPGLLYALCWWEKNRGDGR